MLLDTPLQMIGNTPLVQVAPQIFAKLEAGNTSGSIKARMALTMVQQAMARGELRLGDMIIEATSGNTGIAFAMLAAVMGFGMTAVMPRDMSRERQQMIQQYGGRIELVGESDFVGAVARADELAAGIKGAYRPNQFANPDNVLAHATGTGPEILRDVQEMPGMPRIAAFVAGVGTGGTLMGVSRALKAVYPEVEAVAVEPEEASIMLNGKTGPHLIQGIGDGLIPAIVDVGKIDRIVTVSSGDAVARTKRLIAAGWPVGVSSGANMVAAERYVEEHKPEGIVVTVFADGTDRYLSML